MLTKEFPKFVWEENVQALGMPHFYLGKHKHSLSKFVLYLYFLFPALIILGIGSLLAIIAFIFEKIYANMCKSSKQFN